LRRSGKLAANVYVACAAGKVSFGSLVVPGNPSFLAKLDAEGNFLWTRIVPASTLAVDQDGNCVVAYRNGTGGGLSKYSATGDLIWTRQAKLSNDQTWISPPGLAVDADGNCFFAASFYDGSVSFGNVSVSTDARFDVFVTKYTASGDLRWAIQSQGLDPEGNGTNLRISNVRLAGIASDPFGGILMGAIMSGTVQFGDTALDGPPNNGNYSVMAARVIDPDPPLPKLRIAASKSGLYLSWAASLNGFVLESSDSFSSPTWAQVGASSTVEGREYGVTLQIEQKSKFFRLRQP
jgi:hypothetical protein